MFNENTLDVTTLEPRQKHPTIFSRFDQLKEGESLIINNDHDPKPLYYQLLGERGDIFSWEYLEQGPDLWKVRIGKKVQGAETLGQIAAKDLRKARIFKKYGLDFCCGGKKTVREACMEKGLDVTRIEQELQQMDQARDASPIPYNDWNAGFLADYIVNTHHSYVRKNLPDIKAYALKVLKVHGNRHTELVALYQLVEKIDAELTAHLKIEEQILFPYIKMLASAVKGVAPDGEIPFGAIGNPIQRMEIEHETVGTLLAQIRILTDNYRLPEDACASYSLLYRMLDEFENDLHVHVHLENNILFPKAIGLEKELSL